MVMDAQFLATGENQHVFAGSDDIEGTAWVYKIPASFGYTLPFEHRFQAFRPKNSRERFLRFALVQVPRRVKVFQAPRRIGHGLLAAYCKRIRSNDFKRMLDILDYLSEQGVSDIPLPFTVIRKGEILLGIDEATIRYEGPILKQRRADYFFEKSVKLTTFDWSEFVHAQHRLWKRGVGLSSAGEILGPKNWALLDGRIHLADTGALTRDYHEARNCLSEETLDKRQENALDHLKQIGSTDPALEYFLFIRKQINQEKLDELWGADLKDRKSVQASGAAAPLSDI